MLLAISSNLSQMWTILFAGSTFLSDLFGKIMAFSAKGALLG